jgi:hypothetical protein
VKGIEEIYRTRDGGSNRGRWSDIPVDLTKDLPMTSLETRFAWNKSSCPERLTCSGIACRIQARLGSAICDQRPSRLLPWGARRCIGLHVRIDPYSVR